jgi:GNAT superfamily N-acetyltransferase
MQIIEIERTDHHAVREFIDLPFRIYRDIPQWVPPLRPAEKARFKSGWPFLRHSEAAFFLVRDEEGQPVGRMSVSEHRPHNGYRGKRDALIYLYEAVDRDDVARLLFETAEKWARRRGLTRLVGPKGFFAGDGLGLLIEGFEHRPALGTPYNPAYYVRQWEELGRMEKVVDYLSAYADKDSFEYPERVRRVAAMVRERRGFQVPLFTSKKQILAHAEALKNAYNNAFVTVWAYTPIPDQDMEAIIKNLLTIADPGLMKVVFKGEELAGFAFAYPDISAALQRCKGRIWPFGWLMILLEKRRTQWLCLNGQGVLPKFQGLGANVVVYDAMIRSLIDSRYRYGDLVQVQEDNQKVLADMSELLPFSVFKRHRMYARSL